MTESAEEVGSVRVVAIGDVTRFVWSITKLCCKFFIILSILVIIWEGFVWSITKLSCKFILIIWEGCVWSITKLCCELCIIISSALVIMASTMLGAYIVLGSTKIGIVIGIGLVGNLGYLGQFWSIL